MAGVGKVVVVTGASRGIGYAIGKELATRMSGASVYLTTRQKNLEVLENTLRRDIGVAADSARFRFMDLKDKKSILKFVDLVKRRHGRLDILVNNAGVYHKPPATFSQGDIPLRMKEVEEIVKTNYLGLKLATESFLPEMAEGSRIVNISSHLSDIPDADSHGLGFNNTDLSMNSLDNMMKEYVESIPKGTVAKLGLPDCAYSVTKLAVNCYTRLLQERIDAKPEWAKKGISVNAICPGTMHSKMKLTREETISASDAADVISYLATLKMDKVGDCTSWKKMPKGQVFWHDMTYMKDRKPRKRAEAVAH